MKKEVLTVFAVLPLVVTTPMLILDFSLFCGIKLDLKNTSYQENVPKNPSWTGGNE